MPELSYELLLEGRAPIRGSMRLQAGENRLVLPLPEGKLEGLRALLPLSLGEDEKVFMNGYQTWTNSPEQGRTGYTKGVGPLPETMIRGLGLRSYGDYFFVDYPQRPGVSHGESWCYFREGERFRLFASLDERPGYTLFRYDVSRGLLEIRRDCAAAETSTPWTSSLPRAGKTRSSTPGSAPWGSGPGPGRGWRAIPAGTTATRTFPPRASDRICWAARPCCGREICSRSTTAGSPPWATGWSRTGRNSPRG